MERPFTFGVFVVLTVLIVSCYATQNSGLVKFIYLLLFFHLFYLLGCATTLSHKSLHTLCMKLSTIPITIMSLVDGVVTVVVDDRG